MKNSMFSLVHANQLAFFYTVKNIRPEDVNPLLLVKIPDGHLVITKCCHDVVISLPPPISAHI